MIYICRKRSALGVATEAVDAKDFDEFVSKYPELEPLGACQNELELRRYGLNLSMDKLAREQYERSILHTGR
jgi:hypothetical protein